MFFWWNNRTPFFILQKAHFYLYLWFEQCCVSCCCCNHTWNLLSQHGAFSLCPCEQFELRTWCRALTLSRRDGEFLLFMYIFEFTPHGLAWQVYSLLDLYFSLPVCHIVSFNPAWKTHSQRQTAADVHQNMTNLWRKINC